MFKIRKNPCENTFLASDSFVNSILCLFYIFNLETNLGHVSARSSSIRVFHNLLHLFVHCLMLHPIKLSYAVLVLRFINRPADRPSVFPSLNEDRLDFCRTKYIFLFCEAPDNLGFIIRIHSKTKSNIAGSVSFLGTDFHVISSPQISS